MNRVAGGSREAVNRSEARGCEAGTTGPDSHAGERPGLWLPGCGGVVEAEAARHDDEERAVVDERELLVEEPRVGSWLAPELGD